MENATEALKMAGGVLIFVLALSICINAFTNTRQGIDNIVLYSDREFLTTYVEQNKGTKRIVGAESIVPTIYRAYKENIKIKFDFLNNEDNNWLYYKETTDGTKEYINYIDLERENIADETMKEYILKRILFGDGDHRNNIEDDKENKISWKFNIDGLYNKLKGNTYEESLGVYFIDEVNGTETKSAINKTEKKVITYDIVASS